MTTEDFEELSMAIRESFSSPNVKDSNLEDANIVDVLYLLSERTRQASEAITPNAGGSQDATGGYVSSLTEATMGVTAALVRIAESISELASAVRMTTDQ